MIWTLLRKELVEHGLLFALLIPATLFGFVLVLATSALQEAGSALDSVHLYGLTLHVLTSLVICNRLVVQEYSGKTQLFLEGLPVSRSTMLWTKYLFGMAIVVTLMACCFLLALAVASRQEIIDARFVQIMTSRLVVFVFSSYSFFFMMGLLGRYRIPIYLGLFFSLMILSQATSLDLSQQGPFALLNHQFAFERVEFPIRSLLECSIAGGVFVVIAMSMGLVREGSVASLMAEKMSHREKLFATVAVLVLMFAGFVIDEKQTPDAYTIPNAYTRDSDEIVVHVELAEDRGAVTELADQMHADLSAVRNYLAIDNMPDLYVVNRRDLDADRYEPAKLENASGMLIRANYVSPQWSYKAFQPFLIDACLSDVSNYNAIYEPQCWVLEGFSEYWPRKHSFGAQWSDSATVDLRAAYGASLGCVENDIDDWYRFRDRVGEPIARGLACSGLVFAERKYGTEKLRTFLQEAMRTDQPGDARADIDQLRRPIAEVWKQTIGSDYREFLRDWIDELDALTKRYGDKLDAIPRLTSQAVFVPRSTSTYELAITPRCLPAAEDGNITVRFEEISVFDAWESNRLTESRTELYEPEKTITLADTFAVGGRIRWTTSVFVPQLDCDVISGWRHQEVK
jgi:hypothetical protein